MAFKSMVNAAFEARLLLRSSHQRTVLLGTVNRLECPIIPRESLAEEIRQLITPAETSRLYHLIIGDYGTGKTNLIKLAVNSIDEPKGIVYIDIPTEHCLEIDVVKRMQNALGWSPIYRREPAFLDEALEVFSRLAIKYKQKYGKIPVLIIDNVNRLIQKHQRLLDLFQDHAKDASDNGTAAVVFVSSENQVLHYMMKRRSSWSRSGRIIEIGDVSKEEALQYLKLREIDEKQAAQIYKLVGGRMIHLRSMADENGTLEAMRQTMFSYASSRLRSAAILPGLRYHKVGGGIIRKLFEKESISVDTYYGLVGTDIGDKLLETDIFAFHFNPREITFQSTMMRRFCEENSALWK